MTRSGCRSRDAAVGMARSGWCDTSDLEEEHA
jgi:hypothetical protein